MSRSINQSKRLINLHKIFLEETDEENGLSTKELIRKLSEYYDISVCRKTLYRDIEALRETGLDVIQQHKGRKVLYFVGERDFELAEVILLVDAIQAFRSIPVEMSQKMIRKLEKLVSYHDAEKLQREVYLPGRVKTINKEVAINIDHIHTAIHQNRMIRFQYYQWSIQKQLEKRHNGQFYRISPWKLVLSDDQYYMIGYDSEDQKIKHYRVDKMMYVESLEGPRQGREVYDHRRIQEYSRRIFNMFGGESMKVTLEASNDMVGIMIDRFGTEIVIIPIENDHFRFTVEIDFSDQFLGWIISLGDKVRIIGPQKAVEAMREHAERLARQYLD